jgi:thiol-disulfide isomerase/thioredoxin
MDSSDPYAGRVTTGLVVLVAALAVATVLGLARHRYDGRFRDVDTSPAQDGASPTDVAPPSGPGHDTASAYPDGPARPDGPAHAHPDGPAHAHPTTPVSSTSGPVEKLNAADLGDDLGERATFVQFSSAFCAPCRATRQLLRDVAGKEEGVAFVEIDAESHLDLIRRLRVMRTPTVLVLDADGQVVVRASGQPRRPDVHKALQRAAATA